MTSFQVSRFTLEQYLRSEKKISELQSELRGTTGFLFKSIDVSKKGLIAFTDFQSYLLKKSYPFSPDDVRMLFGFLDRKSKGSLSLIDFCDVVSNRPSKSAETPGPSFSPITELKFYLLLREWLSSLKYRQDLSRNSELLVELDPENLGFVTLQAVLQLCQLTDAEIVNQIFGFKGREKISRWEFVHALKGSCNINSNNNERLNHKKSSSLLKIKDLRDLDYQNYLDKLSEIKTDRYGKGLIFSSAEKDVFSSRKAQENGFFSANRTLNFHYGSNKKKVMSGRDFLETKFNSPFSTFQPNGGRDKLTGLHSINNQIQFLGSKEHSRSWYENPETAFNGYFSARGKGTTDNDLQSPQDPQEMIETMTKIVENLTKSQISDQNSFKTEQLTTPKKEEPRAGLQATSNNEEENAQKLVSFAPCDSPELQLFYQEPKPNNTSFPKVYTIQLNPPNEPQIEKIEEIQSNYLRDGKTTNSIVLEPSESRNSGSKMEETQSWLKVPDNKDSAGERKNSSIIYESLLLSLEDMYRQMKRRILIYQQPIVSLMLANNEGGLTDLEAFFKRSLSEIFNIQSFAIYSDNKIRTPYPEEKQRFESLKLESLLMDSFSIRSSDDNLEKKGVFIQKIEGKHNAMLVICIDQPGEDNLLFNYFQLSEMFNFLGFKEHLAKYMMLIDSVLVSKKETESWIVAKELLNLIEYFVVNFKVLFLEHIKKVLSRSFDLEIIVNLISSPKSARAKKAKQSRMSNFKDLLDQNSDPNELSLAVPNENCSFAIKFKDQGQNRNYFAIIYEQAMDIFQQLRSLVNSHSERLLFYEHFLESGSKNSLLLDFDKRGNLIFISQPLSKNIRDFLALPNEPKLQKKTADFLTLFDKKSEMYGIAMKTLSKNIRLKNLKDFLIKSMNFLGPEHQHGASPAEGSLASKIKVITRGKSKNFKGFYILVQLNDKARDEDDEVEEEDENDAIEMKNEKLPQTWSSETKLLKKGRTLQTSAMVQRSLIMKSATMRNSILLDYVDEGLKSLIAPDKKESLPMGKTSFDSAVDIKSAEEMKIQKKKVVYQPSSKPKLELFSLSSELISHQKFEDLNDLDFNVLKLDNMELNHLAWRLMNNYGVFESYQIKLETWLEFIWRMERKYNKRDNPFHNFHHGLTVMHGCFCLSNLPSLRTMIPEFDKMVLTFSGLCHDVSHTAHNNSFEMNSFSKLAIRYNDKSVLENHHLTTTFKILQIPQCNIFEKMELADFIALRKYMISNILSTDMKEHFTILHNFEVKLKDANFEREKILQSEADKLAVYGMLIHCCDFFGNIKPFEISKEWSTKVNKEFSQQYIDEGKLGLPQTPYYKDLDHKETLIRNEINFTKVIIQPLWSLLNQFLQNEIESCINNSIANMSSWENILEEAEKQKSPQKRSWIETITEEEAKERTEKTEIEFEGPGEKLDDLSSEEDDGNGSDGN